jgi:hypothetical protein
MLIFLPYANKIAGTIFDGGRKLVQRLTGRLRRRIVIREKVDASKIYSEQRGDGGCVAARCEEFEAARCGAAGLRV